MSYTEIQDTKFELADTLTWGVVKNKKYGGYSIPIVLDTDTADKVRSIAEEHGAKDPIYGNTIYLKSKKLSETQTKELLGKDRCHVEVHFTIRGVYTREDTSHLVTKVTKLRRVEDSDSDSCPED